MSTRHRISIERNKASGRQCEVSSCYRSVQKFGRYCDYHDKRNELTGHPLGHTIRTSELKFYLKQTSSYIRRHKDHPAIAACLQWLHDLVYGSRIRRLERRSTATPQQRLCRWLDQLERSGVYPEELLAITAAFFLYREDRPQAFKSDRHFHHQLAIRFLRKAPAPFIQTYRAGVGARRYDRITVGVRDLLAKRLVEAIGLPCLRMATVLHRSMHPLNPIIKAAPEHTAVRRIPLRRNNELTNDPKTLEPGYTVDPARMWSPKQTTNMSGFQAHSYDDNHLSRSTIHSDGRQETQVSGVVRTDARQWAASQEQAPWTHARDHRNGSTLAPHQVSGDSILTFSNFPAEVTLDQAYALGLLQRPNQGGAPTQSPVPQGATTGEQQQQQRNEELHPDLQEEPISREVEKELGDLFQATSVMTHVQAFHELASEGSVSQATLAAAASQMGVEPSQVQAAIDNLRPHFEKQANDVAARMGVDPASVWEWAWQTQPGKMQEAINRQLQMRNTHGYQKIAEEYVRNLDTIAPEMILNAQFGNGTTAAKAKDGSIVLTTRDGIQVGWSEAVGAGFISLSRG